VSGFAALGVVLWVLSMAQVIAWGAGAPMIFLYYNCFLAVVVLVLCGMVKG
jgi:hypothetical protein